MSLNGIVTASRSRRIRDTSGRRETILSWNEQITQRLPAPWKGRIMATQRSDESKGENRCGQGQTQTKHEWNGM